MSTLVDAGFIIWGFFALYGLIIIAYFTWMVIANRSDGPQHPYDSQE